MNDIRLIACFLVAMFFYASASAAPQKESVDSVTGAGTWATKNNGVYFSLTQILPEQARAFYVNRGFSVEQINEYAASCVYMTVLRNDSAPDTIHFISNTWEVVVNGEKKSLVSVNDWLSRLHQLAVKKPALIAFRWAQFPPEQEYEPGGDWNQGMLSVGLSPGSTFDVVARWDIQGKEYQTTLTGVHCAK